MGEREGQGEGGEEKGMKGRREGHLESGEAS